MPQVLQIQHVTVIVDNLEKACAFYEHELGLQRLPTFNLDFPAQFFRLNERQQIHVSEWPDTPSFRGHICLQVDDFTAYFQRMKALGVIDTTPWGKVRRLPDGAMQMFVRDPAGNLIEISCAPDSPFDAAILADELAQAGTSLYVSNRNDGRGERGGDATLYHERTEP